MCFGHTRAHTRTDAQSALVALWLGSAGSLDVDASELEAATEVSDGLSPRVAMMSDCPPAAPGNYPNYAFTGAAADARCTRSRTRARAAAILTRIGFESHVLRARRADRKCVVDSSPGLCALLRRFDTALLREVRASIARVRARTR